MFCLQLFLLSLTQKHSRSRGAKEEQFRFYLSCGFNTKHTWNSSKTSNVQNVCGGLTQAGISVTCSLPLLGNGGYNQKVKSQKNFWLDRLISEGEGKNKNKKLEQNKPSPYKWWMERQSLTTSHKETAAQPVSKQQLLRKNLPPSFIAEHDVTWYGLLWSIQVSSPGSVTSQQRRPWHCVSTFQHYLKHQSTINTVLVTNLTHGTLSAAVKKINSSSSQALYNIPVWEQQ